MHSFAGRVNCLRLSHEPCFLLIHCSLFFFLSSHRKPWYTKFRTELTNTKSIEEIDHFLSYKVERWRGRAPRGLNADEEAEEDTQAPCEHSRDDPLDMDFLQ
jgi:hypothetical protein